MTSPMRRLIDNLLCASRTYDNNDQPVYGDSPLIKAVLDGMPTNARPAFLECQLVLKGGYAVAGVLTTTAEDTLRLLAPAKKQGGGAIMADHYFDYDDVLTIVIGRDLPGVTQPRASSSLILG